MSLHQKARIDKEQRVSAIIDFASRLGQQLNSNVLDPSLQVKLSEQFKSSFPLPARALVERLDELGRSIWNSSVRLYQSDPVAARMTPQLRVFAFYLLDMAHQAICKQGRNNVGNMIRVLRVSLKAGRSCIEQNELDLASKLFQRSASYVETRGREAGSPVKGDDKEDIVQEEIMEELTTEYYLLRAALAWKSERIDLTQYWLAKVVIHVDHGTASCLVEKKADLEYEIGKAELKKKRHGDATKWLEMSRDTMDAINQEDLTPDCCELRLAVTNDLIRALIGLKDQASLSKASSLLALLQMEHTELKLSTCLVQLKLLFAQSPVESGKIFDVISHIIQSTRMVESNFDIIMQQIQKLKRIKTNDDLADSQGIDLACQALDLLLSRLYPVENYSWLEKVIVTRIWIVVSDRPTSDSATRLNELFGEYLSNTGQAFSPEAAHAAQSLIWKRIDASFGAGQGGDSETWCRLACHAIFRQASDSNKSKLGRKMMLHALEKDDTATAREAYFQMPENGRGAPITRYILYKMALRSGDADLAAESLDVVLKSSKSDTTFLYACVLETQQRGNRQQVIGVLQKVLEHYKAGAPEGVHLPALLRSTAKMMMVEMEKDTASKQAALPELCKIFEGAMTQSKCLRSTAQNGSESCYLAELRWFAGHSYNLALTHLSEMHPELLIRSMTVCIAFIALLRGEDSNDHSLVHRLLLCHFLAASAMIVLGRSEDEVERSLSFYLDARRQIEGFQECFQEASGQANLPADIQDDLVAKDFELLKYDLEALMELQHWNDLDRVLKLCLEQKHSKRWGAMADLIIHIHTHIVNAQLDSQYQSKIPLVMEKIINISWENEKFNIRKLARWIRCLFQMTLNIDPTMSLKCLDNALAIVTRMRSAQQQQKPTYPEEELAWLATSGFNHAVDLYCAQDKGGSRRWAEKALELALGTGLAGLHNVLEAKWLRMQTSTG